MGPFVTWCQNDSCLVQETRDEEGAFFKDLRADAASIYLLHSVLESKPGKAHNVPGQLPSIPCTRVLGAQHGFDTKQVLNRTLRKWIGLYKFGWFCYHIHWCRKEVRKQHNSPWKKVQWHRHKVKKNCQFFLWSLRNHWFEESLSCFMRYQIWSYLGA